jgi:regulator of sigma E protease
MLITALAFIFVLGILIFIHELGHFLVAKKVGIRVEKFSLGFPPNIFSRKYGETEYCIGVVPLGGFVKMAGENPEEEVKGSPDEFMSKTVGQRAAVIFAGPFMNYVLAIVLLIGLFAFGSQPIFDSDRILVGELQDGAPAMKSGMKSGEEIIAVDGNSVSNFDSLRVLINAKVEKPVVVTWVRGTDTVTKEMTTISQPIPQPDGSMDTVGLIGFQQQAIGHERMSFGEAVVGGFVATHRLVYLTFNFVKQFITGEVSAKMIGGPLFIAKQSGVEAKKGFASLFRFMALLSVNLAVLNILPIPILDGGHLTFLLIEKVKGSPLSIKARAIAQQVGIVLLLTLVVFVTYNDIMRVIRGF